LSVAGLGLGISLGGFLWVGLLWIFLRRRIGSLDEKEIFFAATKFIGASLLAGLAAWIVLRILDNFVNMRTGIGVFIQGTGAGLAAIAVYIAIGILSKCPEAATFWQTLKNRLPWSRVAPKEEVISEQQ
ncbi:MAG: hypothetical protein PHQ47_03035, partial [Candidatus Portnoybacteria bacterium]|nr:hypothetical protein [Candidatus Portnoybacteria bacterium]